jgi:hypothetical protein
MKENKENEKFHIVKKDVNINHYSYLDLDHFIRIDLNRHDREIQSHALENSRAKKTSYSIELFNLLKLVLNSSSIRIYHDDDVTQLFNDYIDTDNELITEFLEANKYCLKTLQPLLDDYIDNKYLENNRLESVVNMMITVMYDANFEDINSDYFDELFDNAYDFIKNEDEFELTLINCSENHTFYKTIEIPMKEYLKEQLEQLKSPA